MTNVAPPNIFHGNSDRIMRVLRRFICEKVNVESKIMYHPQDRVNDFYSVKPGKRQLASYNKKMVQKY